MHCLAMLLYTPTGKAGKGGKSVKNDGAFDGFLKEVESMHAQGKSSFEAEFNVSLSPLVHIPGRAHPTFLSAVVI